MSEIASIGSSSLLKQFICGFAFLGLLLTGLGISAYLDRAAQREEHERRRRLYEEMTRDDP